MTAPWPGLGHDPAPGDPAAVGALVGTLTTAALRLRETHDALAALTRDRASWEGEAARAFAAALHELPGYLAGAQESLGRARALLSGWQGSLDGFGVRGRDLESRAVRARRDLRRAEAAERAARDHPDLALVGRTVPAEELPAVRARVDAARAGVDEAVRAVATLRTELEDLLGAAGVLHDEYRTEARRVADGVRRSDDGLAPPEPARFADAVGWVEENLGTIGDAAGVVSAVAGALALVPVLTPFAGPVALVAGGVAALAHGAELVVDEDKRADPGAWIGFGADLVGLVPGGRLVVGEAVDLARLLSEAGPGYAAIGGVLGAAEGFGRAVRGTADAGPIAEIVGVRLAGHLDSLVGSAHAVDPTLVARAVEATLATSVQGPTVAEWTTADDLALEKNVNAGAGSARTALDEWLGDLARAAP